jgi:hypothetical protein
MPFRSYIVSVACLDKHYTSITATTKKKTSLTNKRENQKNL